MRPPLSPPLMPPLIAPLMPTNPAHNPKKKTPLQRARHPSFFYQILANTDFIHLALCYNPRNLWT